MENLPSHPPEEAEDFVAPITGEAENPNIHREIKDLGHQGHAEERQEIARSFWENRRNAREANEQKVALEEGLAELVGKIADSEKNTISRWYSVLTGKSEQLNEQKEQLETGLSDLDKTLEETPANEEAIKARIEQHYQDLRKEWESLPYERADIEKYFTAENLSSISMEDYLTLLRRFPASILTHVTRQGLRDHTGMLEHSLGQGRLHDGMKKLLGDGNLRSAIGVHFAKREDEEAIGSYLRYIVGLIQENSGGEARDEASLLRDYVDYICESDKPSDWARLGDNTALHFGLNAVMDQYYGAERGNECFAIWPTAYLMNEYRIGGNSTNDSQPWDKNNDIWVFAKERDGVPLDAGIVFLPGRTPVNPETGSKYEVVDGEPVYNQGLADQITTAINHPGLNEVIEKIGSTKRSDRRHEHDDELQTELNGIGITDPELAASIVENFFQSFRDLPYKKVNYGEEWASNPERDAREILNECGLEYVRAETTIPAEQYWEDYFSKNPTARPAHIVYYSGDPTIAYADYLQKNGVKHDARTYFSKNASNNTNATQELRETFSDKLGAEDPDYPSRVESFRRLAHKVIDRISQVEEPANR